VADALESLLWGAPMSSVEPPAVLGAELARAICGRYEEMRGATLVVEADGNVTLAVIHWYAPKGPVSRSFLGLDARGEVVLYQWNEAIKVEIAHNGKEPVSGVSFLGRHFRRAH